LCDLDAATTTSSAFGEQRSQRHSRHLAGCELLLQFRESFLDRPDRPAFVCRQLLDRRPFIVQRTDVSKLDKFPAVRFVNPSQWQTLSSADIWPIGINAAGSVSIEKCAGPGQMRLLFREQNCVVESDVFRLNLKNSQFIDTALAATASALQACAMSVRDLACAIIHFAVESPQRGQGVAVRWTAVGA
jgi:hypothetical protein